jgi:hypothetical protein
MGAESNEQLTQDIEKLKKDLEKKADISALVDYLKRTEVRPKALLENPEENGSEGSSSASKESSNSSDSDLATQKDVSDATSTPFWQNTKDAEFVGYAWAWQAAKLELPPIFNLEVLSDTLLKKIGVERNEWGFLSRARPQEGEGEGEGNGSGEGGTGGNNGSNGNNGSSGNNGSGGNGTTNSNNGSGTTNTAGRNNAGGNNNGTGDGQAARRQRQELRDTENQARSTRQELQNTRAPLRQTTDGVTGLADAVG